MKFLIAFLIITCIMTASAQSPTPDKIFINATVWTGESSQPFAQAVAVYDGKILAVGPNVKIAPLAGAETTIIDTGGKLMLPGFIDNHTHFMSGGFHLESIDLRYAKDEEEFAQMIGEWASQHPGRWVTGGTWDHDNWPGGTLPTKELIDRYAPDTPVFVSRYDGHMAVANSYVLQLAGITAETPDPPGGQIVRDPHTGEPTGLLRDEAMNLVYPHIPDPNEEERMEAALRALAEARRLGVTSIQDISSPDDFRLYQSLRNNGELTVRIYAILPIWLWEHLATGGIQAPFGDEYIRIGALKAFADGSLGSSTALFYEPYDSDPDTRGLPMDVVLDGRLERWAIGADRAGLQLAIHAIGDSANSMMLDLFEKIISVNPERDRRFRIEHAQHIHPEDFQRFAELGVIASVQPYHAIDDGRWAEGRIGFTRCQTTYPFRTFIDNGVKMSFGSDWTVAPLNPLYGIYAAVTRRTIDGENPDGWFPEQKISVEEAVRAYTIGAAYAAYDEHDKGTITPGKYADLVLLSKNIFEIDPVDIENVEVVMTVVGGDVVYDGRK
jgi:predicted amidohydrolase YtcJ